MQKQVPSYLHLLIFSSKEFHKMAFFPPGLFQVLGRTYYLEKKIHAKMSNINSCNANGRCHFSKRWPLTPCTHLPRPWWVATKLPPKRHYIHFISNTVVQHKYSPQSQKRKKEKTFWLSFESFLQTKLPCLNKLQEKLCKNKNRQVT